MSFIAFFMVSVISIGKIAAAIFSVGKAYLVQMKMATAIEWLHFLTELCYMKLTCITTNHLDIGGVGGIHRLHLQLHLLDCGQTIAQANSSYARIERRSLISPQIFQNSLTFPRVAKFCDNSRFFPWFVATL